MPTALSTTKRKFNRLLDTISSNASSTSLPPTTNNTLNASTTTLPVTPAPPAKRTRLDRPLSAYVPSRTSFRPETRPLPPDPRPSPAIPALSSTPSSTPKKPPPNFAPWDRGQFLQRLKTYRHVDKWLGKPDSINEVEWAKRGWSCVRKETVRCVGGCEQELVISLEGQRPPQDATRRNDEEAPAAPAAGERRVAEDNKEQNESDEEWREEASKELVKKYAEMTSSAHEGSCLWRRRGCDDTIHRLPLINQATALEGLQQRYHSLDAMAPELPTALITPENLDVSSLLPIAQDFLQAHPKPTKPLDDTSHHDPSAAKTHSTLPRINKSALLLALSGWHAEEDEHIPGLATCSVCFRRLGLWLFKTPASSSDEPDHAQVSSMEHLDVMSEHRDYCPWINAVSQNGHAREAAGATRNSLDGLAGWEMQVRALRNWGAKQLEQGRSVKRLAESSGPTKGLDMEGDDGASVMSEITNGLDAGQEEAERKRKDEERWAKLKRLRQVFFVKGKRKNGGDSRPATAT